MPFVKQTWSNGQTFDATGLNHLEDGIQQGIDAAAAAAAASGSTTQAINAQTGTTYTPVASDAGKLVTLTNAAAVTVTLPQDSALTFPVGGRIDFTGLGVGLVTFAAGTGATVNATPSLVQRARYSAMSAIKVAVNTWLVVGDLA